MKKPLIVGAIVVLVAVAIAYRVLQITVNKFGTGESKESPDKKYEATVHEYWSESFWGTKRHWYEFGMKEMQFGEIIQKLETEPIKGPYFGSRSGHSIITWGTDSSAATFNFPGITITMDVEIEEG